MRNVAHRIILVALIVAMSFSFPSCYTVVKWPGRISPEEGSYLEQGYYQEDGVSSRYFWYDPFYSWYYPDAYTRWRYYYTYPWWWNDYWYWNPGNGGRGEPADIERHIWDQRRGPNWSSPPSAPSTPSNASQPNQKREEPKEKSPSAEPRKDQSRRNPDWKQGQSDHSSDELKSRDRGQKEEGEKTGDEQ